MSAHLSRSDATHPLLIVLSGPSGVGKDAVLSRMKEMGKPYHFTVTTTTRSRRSSERDGVDYIFVPEHEFILMITEDELLEWAKVYGNYYGVPKSQVVQALEMGRDVIIKIDVQGATTIKKLAPEAVFIFLAPPNMDELTGRLSQRMTESPETLRLRLETAQREMQEASWFDHVVVNHHDRLDHAVEEIEDVIARERWCGPDREYLW